MTYLVNKPENLGSFAYHCEILVIVSRIHEFLKTPVDVTSSSDMAEWRNTYRNLDRTLDAKSRLFAILTLRVAWRIGSCCTARMSRLL
ncbi:hypothetical protein LB505_012065 [Fusarium chuoi]|nr:hypothetical protein LB505_012065 [Fusarium chuoi]